MATEICAQCILIPPTMLPQARLDVLMRLAAAGAADSRVKILGAGLTAMLVARLGRVPTREEAAQWLCDAVHLLVDYTPDPAGEEVFQTVLWTLGGECGRSVSPIANARKGCGDCEDLASLLVALCMVVGLRARVVWMEQPGSPLNHVSVQVCVDPSRGDDCWLWLDATLPGARLGENPYDALARLGPDFRSRVYGFEDTAAFASAGELVTSLMTDRAADSTRMSGAYTPPAPSPGTVATIGLLNREGTGTMGLTPTMRTNLETLRPLRLVVSPMPPYGAVFLGETRLDDARGVWLADGVSWALPLPAATANTAREVRVTTREGAVRRQRVSISASGDQRVDYAAMTPDTATAPDAAVPSAAVKVTGVPLTNAMPGAIPLDGGSVWVVELTRPADNTAPAIRLAQQPDRTTFAGRVASGVYRVQAYRSTTAAASGQPVLTDHRALPNVIELRDGENAVPFADMIESTPTVEAELREGTTLRVTGLAEGWRVAIVGGTAGPQTCLAPDACTVALPAAGAVVRIALYRDASTASTPLVVRTVSVPPGGLEVDVSFDIRRAAQFAVGLDGLVSCDAKGLRCGYLSDVTLYANEQSKFLPDAAARRVVKEFERLTAPDAQGRAIYAVFVKGHGMTALRATVPQAQRLARDLAVLSTGKVNALGYLPFELDVKSLAPVALVTPR